MVAALLTGLSKRDSESASAPREAITVTAASAVQPLPYSVAEVKRAFRQHGLPLSEQWAETGVRRSFVSPRAGQVFQVDVYSTTHQASSSMNSLVVITSNGYEIRGEVLAQMKQNVRVVYENGRTLVRRRFGAALAELPS